MAVPSSGEISWFGLSQEKKINDYTSSAGAGAIPVISMYDLVNGGNSTGETQADVDITNTNSPSHPNSTAPHAASEWYSYDHDYTAVTVYESSWSPSGTVTVSSHNGTNAIGHATKSAACSSTNTINTCISISWTGTLGNGTTLYFMYGNTCVQNTVLDGNNRYIKMGSFGGGIGSNCATAYPGGTVGNVMKVSDSGVVSEFASSCVTLVGLDVTSTSYPKPVFACGQTDTTTRYFPDSTPAVGDTVYTTSAGTTTLSAGNYGLNQLSSSTNKRFTVDSSGEITLFTSC
jgi:hypothetical protein